MQNPLRNRWRKWAKQCESTKSMDAVINMARMFMQKSFTEFNKDDYLFSCTNGVIDLKTGELMEHDPKFLITQTSKVELNPEGACPTS